MTMLWVVLSTQVIIHQTAKNCNFECSTHHFSRQCFSDDRLSRETDTALGQPNISTLKVRFSNQHKEIDTPTQTYWPISISSNSSSNSFTAILGHAPASNHRVSHDSDRGEFQFSHISFRESESRTDYVIWTFTRLHPTAKTVHVKMGNIVDLSYMIKKGGTRN